MKSVDIYKNKDSEYGIGFDTKGTLSLLTGGFGKHVINVGVDISSFVHVDNKKKDILILGESPTQGLDNTTLTSEKKYSINFSATRNKFWEAFCMMEQTAI